MPIFMCNAGVVYRDRDSGQLCTRFRSSIEKGASEQVIRERSLEPSVFIIQEQLGLIDGEDEFEFSISCTEVLREHVEEILPLARPMDEANADSALHAVEQPTFLN